MRWTPLPALILATGMAFAASPANGDSSRNGRSGFPWFIVPQTSGGTQVLPDFERIWRNDNLREEQKERLHWQKLRTADEQRIRHRYRVETEIALQRAVAMAAAGKPFDERAARAPRKESLAPREPGSGPRGNALQGEDREESKGETLGEKIDGALDAAQKGANAFLREVDNAVDRIVIPQPGRPASSGERGYVFFFALLAVFLVPAVAFSLLLLAILQFRYGNRLQSAVFGLAGWAMLALVVAARGEMQGGSEEEKRATVARLREQCEASAVPLDGFVHAAVPGGVLVTGVKGAEVDEFGWAVVITEKPSARSGERWKLQVYPVGVRQAENALGLFRALPAYADSLDTAVTLRAEAESEAAQWWWQRMLRSIREA
jgi:hypothetical protein